MLNVGMVKAHRAHNGLVLVRYWHVGDLGGHSLDNIRANFTSNFLAVDSIGVVVAVSAAYDAEIAPGYHQILHAAVYELSYIERLPGDIVMHDVSGA